MIVFTQLVPVTRIPEAKMHHCNSRYNTLQVYFNMDGLFCSYSPHMVNNSNYFKILFNDLQHGVLIIIVDLHTKNYNDESLDLDVIWSGWLFRLLICLLFRSLDVQLTVRLIVSFCLSSMFLSCRAFIFVMTLCVTCVASYFRSI